LKEKGPGGKKRSKVKGYENVPEEKAGSGGKSR